MKKFLLQFFTWWNGETLGTRLHTWRFGKSVGQDEAGNVYYEGGTDSEGRTRRWVIYNGYVRSLGDPARLAWLDASPCRHAAGPGRLQAARVAEAASAAI